MCFRRKKEKVPPMQREKSHGRFAKFQRDLLEKKLFPGDTKVIDWKDLYYKVTDCGILASKTMIWNLFLDENRKEAAQQNKTYDKFEKEDFTTERVEFLWNMTESYTTWKTKRVSRWKFDLIRGMFTTKFRSLNWCNCMMSLIILILTILLMVSAFFPMGTGIYNIFELCALAVSVYACGFLWYFGSLLGEDWYPRTYGGLVMNVIFMAVSGILCVVFLHMLLPTYYEGRGCFKCPSCSETPDKLCFEFSRFHEGINNLYAEANTCFCALDLELRSNEPIIPYGKAEEFCAEEGDDCSCEAILRESPENWNATETQQYFNCVYYSPTGAPLFFGLGSAIILGTAIVCGISLLYFIYLFFLCVGCGKGKCTKCIVCGVNFKHEQDEIEMNTRPGERTEMDL